MFRQGYHHRPPTWTAWQRPDKARAVAARPGMDVHCLPGRSERRGQGAHLAGSTSTFPRKRFVHDFTSQRNEFTPGGTARPGGSFRPTCRAGDPGTPGSFCDCRGSCRVPAPGRPPLIRRECHSHVGFGTRLVRGAGLGRDEVEALLALGQAAAREWGDLVSSGAADRAVRMHRSRP